MTWRELKLAEISDIHLGHPNTPTEQIVLNLRKAFPDTRETAELDIIFIAGDVFDRLIYYADTNLKFIKAWIVDFLRQCKRNDTMVRVLEGTPSHDWQQSAHFLYENDDAEIFADLKYQTTLCIEYIERYGINVLYIPDEWKHETDDIWMDVQRELNEKGLEKVDFVVMHGAFSYQLPSHVPVPTHVPERYLSIVKHYVFVGHIHKHSQHQGILAAGSFDRLTHGEEEAKGHLRVTVRRDGQDTIRFVENVGAKLYKSVDCSGKPLDEALQAIDNLVQSLPYGSHVRIVAAKADAISLSIHEIKTKYPLVTITSKLSDGAKVQREAVDRIITPFTPAAITASNVSELLMKRIKSKVSDPAALVLIEDILNGQILRGRG